MKILICGAGAIGIYLGALLNSKGNDVTLFGRRKLKELSETVIINGEEFKVPKKIFRLGKNENYDFIFITCKLYSLGSIVKSIKKNKIKTKVIASIQNGLVDVKPYEKVL